MEGAPEFIQQPAALGQIYVPVTGAGSATTASTTAALTTTTVSSGQAGIPSTLAGAMSATTNPGQPLSTTTTTSTTGAPAGPPARAASQGVAISPTPSRMVPLSAFAHWESTASPTSVRHQDVSPATTISFNLAPGKSLSDATAAVAQAEAAIAMPVTVHGSF